MISYLFDLRVVQSQKTLLYEMTISEMGYTEKMWNRLTDGEKKEVLCEQWNAWAKDNIRGSFRKIE